MKAEKILLWSERRSRPRASFHLRRDVVRQS
jgi:hypothetical protein